MNNVEYVNVKKRKTISKRIFSYKLNYINKKNRPKSILKYINIKSRSLVPDF